LPLWPLFDFDHRIISTSTNPIDDDEINRRMEHVAKSNETVSRDAYDLLMLIYQRKSDRHELPQTMNKSFRIKSSTVLSMTSCLPDSNAL
jgi:hypothetical protein